MTAVPALNFNTARTMLKRKYNRFGRMTMRLPLACITLASLLTVPAAYPVCAQVDTSRVRTEEIAPALRLIGLQFTPAELDSMRDALSDQLQNYRRLREVSIPNSVPPALQFNPLPAGFTIPAKRHAFHAGNPGKVSVPRDEKELAYYSVARLSRLIRTKKITSTELTRLYMKRLKQIGPKLNCVVTLMEEQALAQAAQADREIAAGKYRGPLHGIPYGAKDLLATHGVPTTWGAAPYRTQVFDEDATVIQRLADAGAVLVAKLSMGELAMGDVWFGGRTNNPWDVSQGSSGSSAGSAAAVSAGCVAFAIGTETWGSIVSPSTVCGTTGLRPTYGRVSRHGAMALSWSMDKIGPICRDVEDCAIVFNAICGPDGFDQTLIDAPFNYPPDKGIRQMRIGYLKEDFEHDSLYRQYSEKVFGVLSSLGARLIPVSLQKFPVNDCAVILSAEAAEAFDDLTRSGDAGQLAGQAKDSWPNIFRSARLIPAVEYLRANRVRYEMVQAMQSLMDTIDVYLAPSLSGDNLLMTNLTGHPCVVVPDGFTPAGLPVSITFIGRLFGESEALAVAKLYQDATDFHHRHPDF
jgi:Asp-tRNA(Asn)/Glu-tRNA(Gln) amidotransferase A subunit family amidase